MGLIWYRTLKIKENNARTVQSICGSLNCRTWNHRPVFFHHHRKSEDSKPINHLYTWKRTRKLTYFTGLSSPFVSLLRAGSSISMSVVIKSRERSTALNIAGNHAVSTSRAQSYLSPRRQRQRLMTLHSRWHGTEEQVSKNENNDSCEILSLSLPKTISARACQSGKNSSRIKLPSPTPN